MAQKRTPGRGDTRSGDVMRIRWLDFRAVRLAPARLDLKAAIPGSLAPTPAWRARPTRAEFHWKSRDFDLTRCRRATQLDKSVCT
jgi:hypothetical protein